MVVIVFIMTMPIHSFAVNHTIGGCLVTNQLGSSTETLDFYKLIDYYAYNVQPINNAGYTVQRYQAGYFGGGFDSDDMNDFFNDYVYIYYPGRLFYLNINNSIVTYTVKHSRVLVGSTYYDRLGFAWVSSTSYNFKSLAQNWNGSTALAGENPVYNWVSMAYDYTRATWDWGTLWADTSICNIVTNENIYSTMYDDATGYFHYVNLITLSSSSNFASPFDNFTNIDFDLSAYVSVFCPVSSEGNCYPSSFDLNMDENNKLNFLYNNSDTWNLIPGNYITYTPSSPGSISSSKLENTEHKEVYTTRAPYSRSPQSPGGSGGELGPAESEFKTDSNSEVVSAIDNLTGDISNTHVSQYIPSTSDNYYDLVDELDSAVYNLSSRGDDLSSVCNQASGFFGTVLNGLPSILVAGIVCCAICLFIAKVVNR